MTAGWLRQNLINPMACRLSSVQKPGAPDTAFSVAQSLKTPKNILIVADSRPGALFLAASQFWAIRNHYPEARISLLSHTARHFIASEIPFVDQVFAYEDFLLPFGARLRQTIATLQSQSFDLAFCFSTETHFCPTYLCYKSGARIRIGFHRENVPFFNLRIVPNSEEPYEEQRISLILQTLGIPQVKERVSWSVSAENAKKIQNRFIVGRKPNEDMVALDISSTQGNRPSAKQFLDIARAAAQRVRLLVFFDFSERKTANQIREALGQNALLFETDDLPKIVALLQACRHLIACNSDLFHLGVAMGLSIKGIFPTADIARWVPAVRENIDILEMEQIASWTPEQIEQAFRFSGSEEDNPPVVPL